MLLREFRLLGSSLRVTGGVLRLPLRKPLRKQLSLKVGRSLAA